MGIQINGNTDTISAIDGGLTVSGASLGSASASSLNISGIVTASSFSGPLTGNITGNVAGNLTGNINSTGISTITTLNATSIVGVTTAGITTAYIGSVNDGPISGARNRIINGDMRIDQRNNGASVTPTTLTFGVDRWGSSEQTDGSITLQQSGTVPVGFTSSLLVTVTSADSSLGATQYAILRQGIEGANISDLNWGTSNARPVTLSFWVRSSLTGTFGGAIQNNAQDRSYPFSYTINSANTFEYKTVTIPGDTTGTWLTNNSTGMFVWFSFAAGSTYSGTAATWASSLLFAPTDATNLLGTNGATWYLTGVQLEPGTVATPFERRSYGQELALAQRYCHRWGGDGSSSSQYIRWPMGTWVSSNQIIVGIPHPVTMRTASKSLTVKATSGIEIYSQGLTFATPTYGFNTDAATPDFTNINISSLSGGTAYAVMAGRFINDNTAYFLFSAEL